MTKKNGLFVKINYKNLKKETAREKNIAVNTVNSTAAKFLCCAGTLNKNGGTMIFRANDMFEADFIAKNNPFINSDMYRYEILHGDVIAL
ncbi:hypothetical protein [Clostridium thermarum]|uniref:hypothetical protein n=1 Tax=Clostridium thermarum TaxID=1716543 RepID=UPI00111DE057|nr:hypothetical protein [Clostridium thermarum]